MKIKVLIIILYLVGGKSFAQNLNNVQYPHMQKPSAHKEIKLPNILGYTTLKCDFHMHQLLLEKGLINGVEVFNEQEYYPIVLDWCLNRNMAVISNSDIHDVTANRKNKALYEISNVSAIPFDVETSKGDKLFIPADSSIIMPLDSFNYKGLKIRNLFTGSKSNLKVNLL
ncbi:MAG: hypothetical protein WCP85_01150 [Mariniphaga sp.]